MKSLIVGGLAVVLLLLLVWQWPHSGRSDLRLDEARVAEREAILPPVAERISRPVESVRRVADAKRPVAPGAKLARLFGRCVDVHGNSVAGCRVRLYGWVANSKRMDAYRRNHDAVVWEDPDIYTTGPDGRFSFAFVPPPPYQFRVDFDVERYVRMAGRWRGFLPGDRRDVGDVVFVVGSPVTGRLLERDGRPIVKARVELRIVPVPGEAPWHRKSDIWRRRSFTTSTHDGGRFVMPSVVTEGTWAFVFRNRLVLEPKQIDIPAGGAPVSVDVIVGPEVAMDAITGVVVDRRGEPIAGAVVAPDVGRPVFFHPWRGRSGRDGKFRIKRRRIDPRRPMSLVLRREGFEDAKTKKPVAWGERDVRVVMRRGVDVVLCVSDAKSGESVADYGVRVFPKPGTRGNRSASDMRLRQLGRHENGFTTLAGLIRGSHFLIVEPRGTQWQRSRLIEFGVGDHGVRRLDVRLNRTVSRTVRVTSEDESPVVGTHVDLVEPLAGAALDSETSVVDADGLSVGMRDKQAIRVQAGVTDDHGEIVVRGPGAVPLALRVRGPAHVPTYVNGVVLDASLDTIQVHVTGGARVVGRLSPVELLVKLREQVGLESTGEIEGRDASLLPGLRLVRSHGAASEAIPSTGRVVFAADGSFEITGIPAGDWDLQFVSTKAWGSAYMSASEVVARLEGLRDGDTRKLDLDLRRLIPTKLSGTVFLDGETFKKGRIVLHGRRGRSVTGLELSTSRYLETNGRGRFSTMVPAGVYRLSVHSPDLGGLNLPTAGTVTVVAGRAVEQTFRLSTGRVRLTVLGTDGKPVAGASLSAKSAAHGGPILLPAPNANGLASVRLPIGAWTVRVVRKDLLGRRNRAAFLAEHPGDSTAWERALLEVATVTVEPGPMRPIEVSLPAGAGY